MGVLSAVELKPEPEADVVPFSSDSLAQMKQSAEQMGRASDWAFWGGKRVRELVSRLLNTCLDFRRD